MLNKIISFSIHNKLIIGLLTLALIIYGSLQLSKLPIDAVPDITNNQVQVITVAPSLGATDIERLVTFPVELANRNIPGIKEVRSFSRFGLSLVTIVFDDATDIYWARQQVSERLQQLKKEIPDGIGSISLGPVSTGLGEIYQYTIHAKKGYEDKYDATALRTIQDWTVRRQLLGVEGVADVSSFGGLLKQYEIALNADELKAFNITIQDVFDALERNNQNTGGAYIEKGPSVLYIRSEGLLKSIDEIKSVFIKNTENGTPILVGNVAEVRIGHATRYGALCYNDKGEVAGAVVMMLKGGNSNVVIENIKNKITQIQKTLPEGVAIEPFLDRTKMVNNAIGTVKTNLAEGALIVLFVLVLFLGNLRAGFLVASVIPLAMLFAIIMMNLFGVSGNLMSLGALDFGLIIDGAVIIVEAVLHNIGHHKSIPGKLSLTKSEMNEEVNASASKMMNSAVFGQVIILVVYLPIFFLEGIEGKMFKPMVQTVAFALVGAFILSLTYIPMMSSLVLSKKINPNPTFSDKLMSKIEGGYQKTLERVLNFPKLVLTFVVALFGVAVILLLNMGGEFIPALEEGDFAVETRMLTGSNLQTTIENTQKAAHILKSKFPEVEQIVTKIGSGEIPTDPMPMEAADMMVILKDKKEWTSASTFSELAEKMGKAVSEIPGITTSFQFPVQMRFNELLTGAKQDVVCKIYGEDMDSLAHYAKELGTMAATVEGAASIYVEPVSGMAQIVIKYNRSAIAQYGLNVADVNKVINAGLAGQVSGNLYEGEKRFDIVVRFNENKRKNLEDVRNILIPTKSGSQIALHNVADVNVISGPNQIQREDARRRIIVGFNVRGRDVESVVNELQQKIGEKLKLSEGYEVTYGGAFENLNAAKARLAVTVPVALALIFILLFFAFGSVKQGLLIYSAIPLSATGGIFALLIRGMPFSISAGVGFIALFGVAVLNGIVLIAEFNRLRGSGWDDARKIVLKGTQLRLRPVLMTASVASLGFLPMALSNGAGAEVQRPLATVVIGGLLLATFLTLFVLPILYIVFSGKSGFSINNKSVSAVLILLFMSLSLPSNAQKTLTLQEAIDIALKNNFEVKNEKLRAAYQQKLIHASADLPQTNVTAEVGQINSFYVDNRFGVSQSLSFPSVYAAKREVQQKEWQAALSTVSLKESEIRKNVSQLFYTILQLQKKEQILQSADSIYDIFLKKATLRLERGESNILEKTTAESLRGNIALQLRNLSQELEITKLQLQYVMNTEEAFELNSGSEILAYNLPSDSAGISQHPILQLFDNKIKTSESEIKLEKMKLLPDIGLGYFNMTMRGLGADNVSYSYSTRFSSGQVGIGIPLFFGSQYSKIKALKINRTIAENAYWAQKKNLDVKWEATMKQFQNASQTVDYFKAKALPDAELIIRTARRQFEQGEINYLEWVMLTNQALQTKSNYIDALKNLNESVIELNYLTGKK
jgi:heavy metal efflux system protein